VPPGVQRHTAGPNGGPGFGSAEVVAQIKKRGIRHPFVKNYVLARTTLNVSAWKAASLCSVQSRYGLAPIRVTAVRLMTRIAVILTAEAAEGAEGAGNQTEASASFASSAVTTTAQELFRRLSSESAPNDLTAAAPIRQAALSADA